MDEVELTDGERELIKMCMRGAIQMLAPLVGMVDKVQAYQLECDRSVQRHEAFAPVLDPGHYLAAQRDGTFQDAKNQNEISRHLVRALLAACERDAYVRDIAERRGDT